MYLKLSKGLQGSQGMQARGPSQGVQSPPLLPEYPPPSGDKRLAPAVVEASEDRLALRLCMAGMPSCLIDRMFCLGPT